MRSTRTRFGTSIAAMLGLKPHAERLADRAEKRAVNGLTNQHYTTSWDLSKGIAKMAERGWRVSSQVPVGKGGFMVTYERAAEGSS